LERARPRYRTPLLWFLTSSVVGYALFEEYRAAQPPTAAVERDTDLDAEAEKLRIEEVKPAAAVPGAALFVRISGVDPQRADEVSAEVAKTQAQILQRGAERLVVRVPPQLPLGPAKLRVIQGERRSKAWNLTLTALPRHEMLRNVLGGLALFVLGLRTVGRALRAYAGRSIRATLARLTRGRLRPASLGVVTGLLTQSTTSAGALFAGLLAARMIQLQGALALSLGAQLGAAGAALLLPLFATREALWVIVVGSLWFILAEGRLNRSLASVVVGAGLIFHGLGLLQSGCAPLISDPQVVPYLWYLEAGGLGGLLVCATAGAALGALLQGPAPVYALALSLLSEGVLDLPNALAVLAGLQMGAFVNTFAAAWPFGLEARRLVYAQLAISLATTLLSLAGLPLWLAIAHWAGVPSPADAIDPEPQLLRAQLGLGTSFLALQASSALLGLALAPLGLRLGESLRRSTLPSLRPGSAHGRALLHALNLCERALGGLREIIASSDRSSAAETERALAEAKEVLRDLLRASPTDPETPPPRAASVACLHLADALLSALRVAEKAPELGLSASGEGALALERLHDIIDKALVAISEQLAAERAPSLIDAQAREIEINAVEAETRRRLFESEAAREDLALRLWSSELCAAYETVGNQVYRVASALGAGADDDA
jgi:hypothetical protein